jgi:hypothetical protein
MTAEALSGSCLCGSVRFEVRQPYLRFAHCYCGRCRKATGSSHATNLYVAPPQFSWVSGGWSETFRLGERRQLFYRSLHDVRRSVAALHAEWT